MPGCDPGARPRPLPRAPCSLSPAVSGPRHPPAEAWGAPGAQHPPARPGAAPGQEDARALASVLNRLRRAQRARELQQAAARDSRAPATRDRQEQSEGPAQGATPADRVRAPGPEPAPSSRANARARQVLQRCRAKAEALLWQLSLEQSPALPGEVARGRAAPEQAEGQQHAARKPGPPRGRTLEMRRAGGREQSQRGPRPWAEEERPGRAHVEGIEEAMERKVQVLAQISGAARAQACSARSPGLGLRQHPGASQRRLQCEGDPGPAAGRAAPEKNRGRREHLGHSATVCNLINER
ncbi:PREDICTED: translation initiation factor IF-2-like [Chinchilla lanigera]|uniref:translation initiation factor IF-2-like n=1 Tax=Chinchilla lanigera TaxID=34839 RepID=UPI000695C340|nr:PREDICTED: translation initiation factor IF-2-like [Chinchilla lanigera]